MQFAERCAELLGVLEITVFQRNFGRVTDKGLEATLLRRARVTLRLFAPRISVEVHFPTRFSCFL